MYTYMYVYMYLYMYECVRVGTYVDTYTRIGKLWAMTCSYTQKRYITLHSWYVIPQQWACHCTNTPAIRCPHCRDPHMLECQTWACVYAHEYILKKSYMFVYIHMQRIKIHMYVCMYTSLLYMYLCVCVCAYVDTYRRMTEHWAISR